MSVTDHPNMVYTKKPHPVIADLSAITGFVRVKKDKTADAGTNTIQHQFSDADSLYVIEEITAENHTSASNTIEIIANFTGAYIILEKETSPVANLPVRWRGRIVAENTEAIEGLFTNCNSGDDLELRILGYKVPRFD